MLFGQDRDSIRAVFVDAWRKHRARLPMQPLERLVAGVVERHPEYHAALESDEAPPDREYPPERGESNPFLHMGMHIALEEQLAAGRPAGLTEIYHALATRSGDAHQAEHRMIECLGEVLWRAQREGTMPDESAYLDCLRALVRR
ncbi:MAG: DUF1841 family protein [Chromatiales bacterium]|jgi:hypothetical protein|nr:DUF1841 family protein [Chromatiales bacterium]